MASKSTSRELQAVLRQFFGLLVRDQLVGYQMIRERLAERAGVETELDREVRERAESLDALAKVARQLGLSEGTAPTPKEFNRVAGEMGLDWNSSRVTRLWGRWRFAKDALEGRRVRSTRHHTEGRQRRGRRDRAFSEKDCLGALRHWLESRPGSVTVDSYQRWQTLYNEQLPRGGSHVPGWGTIAANLQIGFREAVEVARGQLSLARARRDELARRSQKGRDWSRTEHHFVGMEWMATHFGVTRVKARVLTERSDFPQPVVAFHRRRAWLREDLEAYFQGKPLPKLRRDGLQQLYLSSGEVAALIGRAKKTLAAGLDSLPQPAGMVSQRYFFLRSEVDEWMLANPERVGRGGHLRGRRRVQRSAPASGA